MDQDIISLTEVSKAFKGQIVLSNVNLKIKSGSIVFLRGANGSGKSMLLKITCGLMNPSSGIVEVCHQAVGNGVMAMRTGIMIDRPAFAPNLSALQNLLLVSSSRDKSTAINILDRIGLSPTDRKPVRKYSMGMKQKVGLAMSMIDNPKVLLLDEPFSNLDDESIARISELMVDFNKARNTTILITGHTREDIQYIEMASKVSCYKIHQGSIISE